MGSKKGSKVGSKVGSKKSLSGEKPNVTYLYKSHDKIYPREVIGPFQLARWVSCAAVLLIYFVAPWVQWQGKQALLFDLSARQFHIFSLTLWPQDFYFLVGLLVMAALTLFLVTAVAGRIWCGYTCPQTAWGELYLAIERWVEGAYRTRIRLDKGRWSWSKGRKKVIKHFLWLSIAFWTGVTFVGLFVPMHTLADQLFSGSLGGWEWFWILFYTLATYGNAGFLREQVCQYMCPYARFQSAMLDKDSLIVTYDRKRGEEDPGDCVDCGICTAVCPTGIDIRDGLQYECIGCAACIDGCNQVMDKLERPRGLISYQSEREVSQNSPFRLKNLFRPRVLCYLSILSVLFIVWSLSLWFRTPISVDIIRDRVAFNSVVNGHVENRYTVKIANKTQKAFRLSIAAINLKGAQVVAEQPLLFKRPLPAGTLTELPIIVKAPQPQSGEKGAVASRFSLVFSTFSDGDMESSIHTVVGDAVFWW